MASKQIAPPHQTTLHGILPDQICWASRCVLFLCHTIQVQTRSWPAEGLCTNGMLICRSRKSRSLVSVFNMILVHPALNPWRFGPLGLPRTWRLMNYIYYCAARVMNCSGVPGSPHGVHHHRNNHDADAGYLAIILLQIAAGLDWPNCLRFNVHTIGIVSLLFACVLRTTNPVVGTWVEDWMIQQGVSDDAEEGSFPNLRVLQALRLVNAGRCAGRNVLAVYQPTDDGS